MTAKTMFMGCLRTAAAPAALLCLLAAPAFAQDSTAPATQDSAAPATQDSAAPATQDSASTAAQESVPAESGTPKAPDGSNAFGFDPYIGITGGYHSFDRDSRPGDPVGGRAEGWLVGGVVGFNIPLGPLFVGAEGNASKGFNDIDWEYGATGRFGFRAGESGLIYASAGYQWIEGRRGFTDSDGVMYGLGVEVGPRSIGLGGITGEAGPRLRLDVKTYDFDSIRPTVGVIFHF